MYYHYSLEKNLELIDKRNISFEDIIHAINSGGLMDVRSHSNQSKYPQQMVYYVLIDDYVYAVPFVHQDEANVFLKTAYPSRNATRYYLRGD